MFINAPGVTVEFYDRSTPQKRKSPWFNYVIRLYLPNLIWIPIENETRPAWNEKFVQIRSSKKLFRLLSLNYKQVRFSLNFVNLIGLNFIRVKNGIRRRCMHLNFVLKPGTKKNRKKLSVIYLEIWLNLNFG